MKRILWIFIILHFFTKIYSQEERSSNFLGIGIKYGVGIPIGKLSERFGSNFEAGVSVDLFKTKLPSVLSLEASIIFGNNVKEDVLANLRLTNGAILGNNGEYADVFLRQRGSYLGLLANKLILPSKKNKNSGLFLGLGLGVMQHKIRISVESRNAPQFENGYDKGYDRNTVGPALKQQFGFINIGKNPAVNFQISLSFTEAFTKNIRPVNYDTGLTDDESRLDFLIGLDFKWILPIKDQRPVEEIFY